MSQLLDKLAHWQPFTALVIGDFMLDQLVFGNADRLSPEAPVPVLHVQRSEDRPGGAANVCLDLIAMHATVHALGVTGDDREADLLRSTLAAAGVQADGLVADASRPTTVKRSLVGLAQHRHPQKMFRVDYESRTPLAPDIEGQIIAKYRELLPTADVICIEDYNKGVCTPAVCRAVIELARKAAIPVLIDPAAVEDYSKYRGATTITPNRSEAALAAGGGDIDEPSPAPTLAIQGEVAQTLLARLELDAVVITLDREGALLLEKPTAGRATRPVLVPTFARQVYDVTGAGDMVLAALAAARANGIDWPDAVRMANAAAGLEVEVFGVVPMPIEKIHREVMLREGVNGQGKIRTLSQLSIELAALRGRDQIARNETSSTARPRVVFANGCFDMLHVGHVSMLQRAAELGDFLIVAVNDDNSVRRLKGPDRPVYGIEDRAAMLAALSCVDAVISFSQDTAVELVRALKPDILVKGRQYDLAKVPEARAILELGGTVELVDVVEGVSTSALVAKVRESGARAS